VASPIENRYDRAVLGEGALGWIYEYRNLTALEKRDAIATGLELGVQLRGEWTHHGSRTGRRIYGPGSVHVISPAERYELSCKATRLETGLQVGFIVYPDEIPGFVEREADVVFSSSPSVDDRFFDFCRAFAEGGVPEAQARDEVLRWVRANVERVASDPLVLAKRALDRSFTHALYLRHIAEVAGMKSEVVFSRKFAARFGMTPIAYRKKLRLNEAARLTWARPDLSISEIGALVGFDDESYFHRAFVAEHGMTPAQYGRRRLLNAGRA
jgi:AraC-like DNA-binding protein